MSKWRDIPALYKWDDGGLAVIQKEKSIQSPPPSKTTVVAVSPSTADLDSQIDAAAKRTEQVLNTVLEMLSPSTIPGAEQGVTQSSALIAPVVTEEDGEDLWEAPAQSMSLSGSPIYPDRRPINNPNHLLLFIGRGAEIVRMYTASGWSSKLRRDDGKENPVPDNIVDSLVKAGQLVEKKPGVFRGAF